MFRAFPQTAYTHTSQSCGQTASGTIISHLAELDALLVKAKASWATYSGGDGIKITSAYRSPSVNSRVGGSSNSAHTAGYAADTQPLKASNKSKYETWAKSWASSGVMFDQIIMEHPSSTSKWVHIAVRSTDGSQQRKQVIDYNGSSYTQISGSSAAAGSSTSEDAAVQIDEAKSISYSDTNNTDWDDKSLYDNYIDNLQCSSPYSTDNATGLNYSANYSANSENSAKLRALYLMGRCINSSYHFSIAQAAGIAANAARETNGLFGTSLYNTNYGTAGLMMFSKARTKAFKVFSGENIELTKATLARQTDYLLYTIGRKGAAIYSGRCGSTPYNCSDVFFSFYGFETHTDDKSSAMKVSRCYAGVLYALWNDSSSAYNDSVGDYRGSGNDSSRIMSGTDGDVYDSSGNNGNATTFDYYEKMFSVSDKTEIENPLLSGYYDNISDASLDASAKSMGLI